MANDAIALRNAADSDYAIARAATPIAANDLVTKNFAETGMGSKGVAYVSTAIVPDVQVLPSTILIGETYIYDKSSANQMLGDLRIAPSNGHKIFVNGSVIEGNGKSTEGAELVTNGDFASNLNGWTVSGGVTWVSGRMQMVGSSGRRADQPISTIIGETYVVTVNYENTVNPTSSGAFAAIYTGLNATGTLLGQVNSQNGLDKNRFKFYFTAQTTTSYIYLSVGDTNDTTFYDDVSIKRAASGYISIKDPWKGFAVTGIDSTTWGLTSFNASKDSFSLFGRDSWVTKTVNPTARRSMSGFTLNGYSYVSCGFVAAVSAVHTQYNDSANTWATLAANPTAREGSTGTTLNGFGYVTCGFTGADSNVHTRYNDSANTWSTLAVNPTARRYPASFTLNGYSYVSGGYTGVVSTVHTQYNDNLNTWTTLTANPTGRERPIGFAVNGYGYSTGGSIAGVPSSVNHQYNSLSNSWVSKANNIVARESMSSAVLSGFGHTFCGSTGVDSGANTQYNDFLNIWVSRSNASARTFVAGSSLNGYGYVTGGLTGAVSNLHEQYN